MKEVDFRAYANSVMLFLFFLAYNTFSNDLDLATNISKALGVAAVILIAVALLLGPLSRFFPKHFRYDLVFRKPLGLAGFFFAALHAIVAFVNTYNADIFYVFSDANMNFFPAVYGSVALLIFIALSIASSPKSIKNMGFNKWKSLQRTAYVALFFAVLHFSFVDKGVFLSSTLGKTILSLGIIAIVFKLIAVVMRKQKKHSKEEIAHLTKK